MTPAEVAALIAGGGPVKRNGRGFRVLCPAHDDRNPSLDVDPADDGKVLILCRVCGAKGSDVVEKVAGLTLGDLMPEDRSTNGNGRHIEATYPYRDGSGAVLFEAVRYVPKDFKQRRADPERPGEWIWNLQGVRRVLFHLPELLAADPWEVVYVTEGERDVLAIERAGGIATCNPMGAGKWRDEYAEHLRDRTVVIVADKDDAGAAHAQAVRASLEGVAASVRIVQAATGNDAADHLAAGKTLDEFADLSMSDTTSGAPLDYLDWDAFWDRDADPEEFVVDDVLAKGRGHAMWARAEQGKSLLTLWFALEAMAGGCVVIYLDWEMTAKDLEDRLSDMGRGPESDLSRLRYALLPSLPMLDTAAGGEALAAVVDETMAQFPGRHVVVIIDTIGRTVAGGESDNDTWLNFYRYSGVPLKRRGVTWLRLDHTGWEGVHSRGASAKYDDVDVVWELKKTDSGVELHAKKRRMPSVPDHVVFTMSANWPLRVERAAQAWPFGTREVINLLDRLAAPVDVSTRAAEKMVRDDGFKYRNEVIRAAVKRRKWEAEEHVEGDGAHSGRTPADAPGRTRGAPTKNRLKWMRAHSGRTGAHPPPAHGAQGAPP